MTHKKFKECDKCHYITDKFTLMEDKCYCNRFCKDKLKWYKTYLDIGLIVI